MKKMKFDVIEFFKTVFIFVLTFSMLTFAGRYMNARQNAGRPEEVPLEKRRIFENGGITPSAIQINPNHINPLQIILTSDSKSITAVYDSKLVSNIYKEFKIFVLELFDNTAECEIIHDEYEAAEIWANCLNASDSVYIRYAGEYIYPIIYDFLEQRERNEENYEPAENRNISKVRELFIIPYDDNDDNYYNYGDYNGNPGFVGVAKDSSGNISVFYPDMHRSENSEDSEDFREEQVYYDLMSINSENFAAYNNIAGIIPCRFLKNGAIEKAIGFNKNNIQNLILPEDFLLFDDFTYSSVLSYTNPIFGEYSEIDMRKSEKIKELLEVFNFRMESSGLHSVEENGKLGKKFIENHGSLIIFENGKIFYSHTSSDTNVTNTNIPYDNANGIHLSSFLGYDSSYYTFYDKIKAASIFINSLSSDIAGNESDLYLSDIKFEQDRLTIVFSYYYRGIKIKMDNQDIGVYIVISKNNITEAKIDALHINDERTARNLKQVAALSYFENELKKTKIMEIETEEENASTHDEDENGDAILDLPITENSDVSVTESNEDILTSPEEIAEIKKMQETEKRFVIKNLELIYNINTTDSNNHILASWVIR